MFSFFSKKKDKIITVENIKISVSPETIEQAFDNAVRNVQMDFLKHSVRKCLIEQIYTKEQVEQTQMAMYDDEANSEKYPLALKVWGQGMGSRYDFPLTEREIIRYFAEQILKGNAVD